MIRAVLFDLDETLFHRRKSLRPFLADQYRLYEQRLGNVTGEIWCRRFLELDQRGHVHPSIVYRVLLSEFAGDLAAVPMLMADYVSRSSQFSEPFEGAKEILAQLKSEGFRLGIISNGEPDLQRRNIAALGLAPYLDVVLISEEEGIRKPDAAIFRRAAERLKVGVADCLFVGDNAVADVLGAADAGMATAWFAYNQQWPKGLRPMPGLIIHALAELRALVPRAQGAEV